MTGKATKQSHKAKPQSKATKQSGKAKRQSKADLYRRNGNDFSAHPVIAARADASLRWAASAMPAMRVPWSRLSSLLPFAKACRFDG
ncbi:hypothetical protein [Lysobacter sp. ESA13C]|uniref:hypothetical protein n=1 Tax=Lysobacter sp. ESA13C TaxID=2862676 RepID=UPI001CBF991A|nr:hypothetical protein [Lysobacter sp. ESA13C]